MILIFFFVNYLFIFREADEALDVSRTRITEHDQWMSAYERERSLYEMACSWTQQTKENKLEDSKRKKIADPEYFSKKSLGFKRGKAFQKLTEKNKKNNYLRSEEGDSNYRFVNQSANILLFLVYILLWLFEKIVIFL